MVDCGVRVAMDNFGAALAPLNHLVRLPIDMVKLDPKLTASVTGAGASWRWWSRSFMCARRLGVQLLAQGIETQEHLRILQELGCELGQGYLPGAALSMPDRHEYLAAHNGRTAAFTDR